MKNYRQAYMNFVCPNCFHSLDECKCKRLHGGHLLRIDRAMQKPIQILREKGYRTGGCCEGHYEDGTPYMHINFAMTKEHIFDFTPVPDGFTYDRKGYTLGYWFNIKNKTEKEFIQDRAKVAEQLVEWCNNLLPIDEIGITKYE